MEKVPPRANCDSSHQTEAASLSLSQNKARSVISHSRSSQAKQRGEFAAGEFYHRPEHPGHPVEKGMEKEDEAFQEAVFDVLFKVLINKKLVAKSPTYIYTQVIARLNMQHVVLLSVVAFCCIISVSYLRFILLNKIHVLSIRNSFNNAPSQKSFLFLRDMHTVHT